jgi:hypothetical protein
MGKMKRKRKHKRWGENMETQLSKGKCHVPPGK